MRLGLHLGLNAVEPAAYNGWPGELYAAVADARSLAALFAQQGCVTRALLNEQATLGALRENLRGLALALNAGDTLVLSFSGHGSRSPGWSWSGYREALCLWDGQFTDTELRAALATFRAGVNVAVLLDCCHSGGMDRGVGLRQTEERNHATVRACPRFISDSLAVGWGEASDEPAVRWGEAPDEPKNFRAPIPASVLLLTACRADEAALDGWTNGAFTGSQLRSREEFPNAAAPTWAQWHLATAELMLREHAPQHPQAIRLGADHIWNQRLVSDT